MPALVFIEVAVPPDTSTTERGRVLERFARKFLVTQNFEVTEELRITGMEVDLLATERTTGERVLVECKAHRANIAAEVLFKILGQVMGKSFSAGWLISTYALSKDAKGFCDEWNAKSPEERRRLQTDLVSFVGG
ncbi:restriction endonuclease [Skermanella pratensis]|uniref:restriction endonuclease n=1 Tax=Skermanella pratensis TaxID=2233999 RepID=UPI001FE432E5|nr:restriction endonuclease [Skermanella pratensis]